MRSTLIGAAVAVAAVVTATVFGSNLSGMVDHPARYGWNWDRYVIAQGGYGHLERAVVDRVMQRQPDVQGWSELAFDTVASMAGTQLLWASTVVAASSSH